MRDREYTKKLIKEVSIDVFSEYGFDKATMKKIAEKCKVSESLIIKYYTSKNGLLLAITEDFINAFINSRKSLNYTQHLNLEDEIIHYTLFTFQAVLDFDKTHKIIIAKTITDESFSNRLQILLVEHEKFDFFLKERIEFLKSINKAPQALEATKIEKTITLHVFAFYLIGTSIFDLHINKLRDDLMDWAAMYARGLQQREGTK